MRWNPYQSFVWTTQELRSWFDYNGTCAFWDGKLWEPIAKRVCPGRYKVTFTEYLP